MREQTGVFGDQRLRHIHLEQTARSSRHAVATDALPLSVVDTASMTCIDNHQHPRCYAISPCVKRRAKMIILQIIC
jgi:hypothetical protein